MGFCCNARFNFCFIRLMISCHDSVSMYVHPIIWRSILRCTDPNFSNDELVIAIAPNPYNALGVTQASKRRNFFLMDNA
eukprot:3455781-Karenia_brevis.AAC.1